MAESPTPVIFHDADYASASRRVVSFLIDLITSFVLLLTVLFAIQFFVVPKKILEAPGSKVERQARINDAMKPYRKQSMSAICVVILAYHLLLRTSRAGTLGYRITGIRLVNEFGQPPDLRTAGRRFLLAVPFCGCFALTYLTCQTGERRQAAHDQWWAGTWVVRNNAEPAGPAVIEHHQKLLGTLVLRYKALAPAVVVASPPIAAEALPVDSR